jgi:translation initiation factor 3 subunit B
MCIPQQEDGSTFGYGFVEYMTVAEAALAVKDGDNKKLDNKHKLRVNLWDDFDKLMEVKEEYTTPEKDDFESQSDLTSW